MRIGLTGGATTVDKLVQQSLLDAGATDIWAAVVPVGADRGDSVRRSTDLLRELL